MVALVAANPDAFRYRDYLAKQRAKDRGIVGDAA